MYFLSNHKMAKVILTSIVLGASGPLQAHVNFQVQNPSQKGMGKTTTFFSFNKSFAEKPACKEFVRYAQEEMNTASVIVLKDSEALLELYANGANQKTKTKVWSISKFLSGLMLGSLVNEHGMKIMDEPLSNFGIERASKQTDKIKDWSKVTLRNVWNMSSGFNWCEYGNCRAKDAAHIMYGKANADATKYVLSQDLTHEPGTYYRYSAGNYLLLQTAMKSFYPQDSDGYQKSPYDLVLKKLEIPFEDFAFEVDKKGTIMGGSGLSLTPRAFAKLGQLLLNKGKYNGKSVVSKEFFTEMTTNSDAIKNSPFAVQNWEGPAGGSIWLNDDSKNGDGLDRDGIPSFMPQSPHSMIYAGGNFGQFLLVYPDSGLVVARQGGDNPHSKHWVPFSNKALECFDPGALREKFDNGVEKKAPDTGKNLSLKEITKNAILSRARAQEMCSCLFVSGYSSVKQCDKMVPTKTQLFSFINNHNIIPKPKVDWKNKTVSVRKRFSTKKFVSRFNSKKPWLGCQLD